ncbi:WSC domain-containing protein [Flagelloscypha sp. PMI_526]|nr:WSC domain-containing protein [Flagelloscypha sp. PMI_526]
MLSAYTLLFAATLAVASPARRQSPAPVPDGTLPGGWNYQGCWVDGANGRVLTYRMDGVIEDPVTVELCVDTCTNAGYAIAGLEYISECWCGNELLNGPALAEADAQCEFGCEGDATEACGGSNRISIYSALEEVPTVPVPTTDLDVTEGWSYVGCLIEQDPRVLPNGHSFTANTPDLCISTCAADGFDAAGLQYASECCKFLVSESSALFTHHILGCGTIAQASAADAAPEGDCFSVCSGDETHLCGGPNRLTVYTTGPLETPEPPA